MYVGMCTTTVDTVLDVKASPAVIVKVEENWDYYAGLRRRRGGAATRSQ